MNNFDLIKIFKDANNFSDIEHPKLISNFELIIVNKCNKIPTFTILQAKI